MNGAGQLQNEQESRPNELFQGEETRTERQELASRSSRRNRESTAARETVEPKEEEEIY